jgi:hypothetical protein
MIRPHVALPDAKGLSYGLGWVVARDLPNGEYALLHDGVNPGVRTLVILLPQSRRGLVVFTNGERGAALCNKIAVESIDVGGEIVRRRTKVIPTEKEDAGKYTYVKLVHVDTGKVLAIADDSEDAGASAVLARDDGSPSHQWRFDKHGEYLKVINRKLSTLVLDVGNDDAIVQRIANQNAKGQLWRMLEIKEQ